MLILPTLTNIPKRVKGQKYTSQFLRKVRRPLILFFLTLVICTCIDPFNPNLKGREAILVVDALLTNENRSYTVELSKTTPAQNEDPPMVSGAFVSITDQIGNITVLNESTSGIYKSDSLTFHCEPGNAYKLYIRTNEGKEYSSESCVMYPVDKIDTIYYRKDQEISNNKSEILDGLRFYIDSENGSGGKYFRWVLDEWWKFSVPFPKLYDYINENNIPEVDQIKKVCYAHTASNDILIHSVSATQTAGIEREPVLFVPSSTSDRLLIQYCIDIKQLSLSDTEYQFWEQMRDLNESGGDIFDKQPFTIAGNIHNINDASEPVLGYFQVSAVEEKRLYIVPSDIENLGLPIYSYDCERIVAGTSDYSGIVSLDDVYLLKMSQGYIFIEPVYGLHPSRVNLAFTTADCALCTLRGNLSPPDFWIDMEPHQK
jgi:hypothetical protein